MNKLFNVKDYVEIFDYLKTKIQLYDPLYDPHIKDDLTIWVDAMGIFFMVYDGSPDVPTSKLLTLGETLLLVSKFKLEHLAIYKEFNGLTC